MLNTTTSTPTTSNSQNFPTKPKPTNSKPKPKTTTTLNFPIPTPQKPLKTTLKLPTPPKKPPISDFQDKMLFLDSIGIDLFALVSSHPPILSSPASDIKSLFSFLRSSVSLTSPDLRRISTMCPDLLCLKTSSVVSVVTFLLREAGVSGVNLRRVIYRRPRLLACDVKTRLRPALYFLQGNVGIVEISKYTYLLSGKVEEKFLPRIEYFRKMGMSRNEAKGVFRRFPALFCYSIEENFGPKFEYFVKEMGRGLNEIVEFPQFFSFSLENRIKPRHRKCVEKGVSLSLPMMLKSSEQRFLERLDVCCDSSMPVRASPLWDIDYDHYGVL